MRQNIFSEVKQYVTARSAAEFYGIHVNHRGMARCPFHDDHTVYRMKGSSKGRKGGKKGRLVTG